MRDPFEDRRPIEVPLTAETTGIVDGLKARYGIEVTLPAEPFEVCAEHVQYLTILEGHAATTEVANWYIPLFEEEFGLYPPLLVHNTRLTRVILCGELFRSQEPNPSAVERNAGPIEQDFQPFYFTHEPCAGVPDAVNGLLYLPINCGEDDPDNMRKTIHHEFYHCIQWQQFGVLGDCEWDAINSPDFVYGPGGIAACYSSDPTFWVMPAEEWGNGFLNQYSMSAPEEDQAEIFAHLITEPARVEARLRADDILRSKVERLKATLKQFCRNMDDGFWQRVDESRLPFDI